MRQVTLSLYMLAAMLFMLPACSNQQSSAGRAAATSAKVDTLPAASRRSPNVVELEAVGTTFIGPRKIPAGWTTFRFSNRSDMVHFAIIDVLPDGVTARQLSSEVMVPFQDAMNAMIAGDEGATNAAFSRFPKWIGQLTRNGGPGLLAAHHTGETTVYIAPGDYVIECYVKTGGVFHSTPASDGAYGMMLPITVMSSNSATAEPQANMTISVTNTGYSIVDGRLHPGTNTIRVNFDEQQTFPSFTGNDIHLMRVASEGQGRRASDWMDWRKPHGLETPAPAEFLGGINDMPAGAHGYFTVDLKPGDYQFIGEQPNPAATGFVLPVSVADEG